MKTLAISSIPATARRGVAPLEFVMALPLLFILMLFIIWEGYWMIGRAEITITARNDAWKQRFDDLSDNPLSFPVLPDYKTAADYARKETSKKIEVSPAFDKLKGPTSEHTLLAGSWDYAALPLEEPPNVKPMVKAALIGSVGGVIDGVSALDGDLLGLAGKFASAKSQGRQEQTRTEQDKSNVGKGGRADESDSGGGTGGTDAGDGKTPEQAQKDAEEELRKRKEALKARFKVLGAKATFPSRDLFPAGGLWGRAQDDLIRAQTDSQLKTQAAINATEEEDKKKKQEEAARARRKVELLQITVKRLKTEANDIATEAESLGMDRFLLNYP